MTESLEFLSGILIGLGIGLGITWWRWKMALQVLDRAREWRQSARRMHLEVRKQRRYAIRIDETMARLATLIRTQIKITTPEHLRSTLAKMVGESPPEKPPAEAGWDKPIPAFEGEPRLPGSKQRLPRGV